MADIIDRSAAQSLIPPELVHEIIQGATKYSVALRIFKRARNMLRDEVLMPALSMLPEGGWLNSDNAVKPLTSQAWEMVEMYAEEYAARVIIPDNVREDAAFDMWRYLWALTNREDSEVISLLHVIKQELLSIVLRTLIMISTKLCH